MIHLFITFIVTQSTGAQFDCSDSANVFPDFKTQDFSNLSLYHKIPWLFPDLMKCPVF